MRAPRLHARRRLPSRMHPCNCWGLDTREGRQLLNRPLSCLPSAPCRVNKYPIQRSFTAIGSGGDVFKSLMISSVEDVVGSVHVECISERSSSQGKYVSVTVGPVWVQSCDQVGCSSDACMQVLRVLLVPVAWSPPLPHLA